MRAIQQSAMDAGGELSPEDEAAFDFLLLEVSDKVDAYCCLIEESERDSVAVQATIDRLAARVKANRTFADRLKSRMKDALKLAKLSRFESANHKVRIQINPASCVCVESDLGKLDPMFTRVTVEPAKAAAMNWFRTTGEMPEGFVLAAPSDHIRIS